MAKHRRSRKQPKSHDRSDSYAFNHHDSIAWDVGHHRRESRLGSHLIPNTPPELQPHSSRPWRLYPELPTPHNHRHPDPRHLHHRTFSTTNTFQPHNPIRQTRKFDHIIRDLFVQGSVIEQKLKRLMEGLQTLHPADEEMEWEGTNAVYYLPLALANVVGGDAPKMEAGVGIGASELGQERETQGAGIETEALGQGLGRGRGDESGLRRTGLASLLAPPPAIVPAKLPWQMGLEKALALGPAGGRWAGGRRSGSW